MARTARIHILGFMVPNHIMDFTDSTEGLMTLFAK
jgi:hypothetical protein